MVRHVIISLSALSIWAAGAAMVEATTDLAIIDSAALGTDRNLPWSEPVQIDDPFEGSFIGVFDRHSFQEQFLNINTLIEVQSLWSQEFIRVLSIVRDRDCLNQSIVNFPSRSCSEFNNARNIVELFIKIDDEVLQIAGENSTFPVNNELAEALQNAPETNIEIRLVTANGETIDSEIGLGTVEAWKTVYGFQDTVVSE
ncbi:MAG: hypothetical protein AAFQ89_02295 [Cyanobacteria bacterium J06626_18]